jgi:hypothetical protein
MECGVIGDLGTVIRILDNREGIGSVIILLLFMKGILVVAVVWIWIFVQVGGSMILKHSFDIEI